MGRLFSNIAAPVKSFFGLGEEGNTSESAEDADAQFEEFPAEDGADEFMNGQDGRDGDARRLQYRDHGMAEDELPTTRDYAPPVDKPRFDFKLDAGAVRQYETTTTMPPPSLPASVTRTPRGRAAVMMQEASASRAPRSAKTMRGTAPRATPVPADDEYDNALESIGTMPLPLPIQSSTSAAAFTGMSVTSSARPSSRTLPVDSRLSSRAGLLSTTAVGCANSACQEFL